MFDALHSTTKNSTKKSNIVIDFPDFKTKEIFASKWHNYAYMLGVFYTDETMGYGLNSFQKIRYVVKLEGSSKLVKEVTEFMDNSLSLVNSDENWPNPVLGIQKG